MSTTTPTRPRGWPRPSPEDERVADDRYRRGDSIGAMPTHGLSSPVGPQTTPASSTTSNASTVPPPTCSTSDQQALGVWCAYDATMSRRRSVAIGGVALLIVVAGATFWFQSRGESVALPAGQVVPQASCLAPNVVVSAMPGAATSNPGIPNAPVAGALPATFDAVGFVVCEFYGDRPENGTQIMRQTERAGGDVVGALAVVNTPTDPPRDPEDCDAVGSAPIPVVWAVDPQSRAVRLELPKDSCGQLKGDPLTAIERVPAVTTQEYELPA